MAVGLGAVSRPLKGAVINIFTMPYVARCPSVLTPPTHTKLDGKSHPPSRSHVITGMNLVQESAKGSLIFNRKAGFVAAAAATAGDRATCTLLTAWFISCVDTLNLGVGGGLYLQRKALVTSTHPASSLSPSQSSGCYIVE